MEIVRVNWVVASGYLFWDEFLREEIKISSHDHIIPTVFSALLYNNIFGNYASRLAAKRITVTPIGC